LELKKADLLALPATLRRFNGVYTNSGNFVVSNPIHILMVMGWLLVVALVAVVLWLRRRLHLRKKLGSDSEGSDKPGRGMHVGRSLRATPQPPAANRSP
jgi:hypothetical protein